MQVFREIEIAELLELLEKESNNVQLFDVRSDGELYEGLIPGSAHLPMHSLPLKINELNKDKITILYCHVGVLSARACAYMTANGFDYVHNLRGGIQAWAKSGLQLFMPAKVAV
ncbi:MAG: rhodanese-like domain-containing protein [Gammaproteobacteria bacterium]|nr:rhodanese-like domain-containing protein [Gammaproteobacteria bacterium]